MLGEEGMKPRPHKQRRAWQVAAATVLLSVMVGVVVKQFVDSHGFVVVSDRVHAFAQEMRIVRPLLFLAAFCFWQALAGFASRVRLLTNGQAVQLVRNRNRFFLWVALLELTLGQGQVVIGVTILLGILVYPWLMNVLQRFYGRDR